MLAAVDLWHAPPSTKTSACEISAALWIVW